MSRSTGVRLALAAALVLGTVLSAQQPPAAGALTPAATAVDRYLAPGYPYELVAAKKAERMAWISYERGRRNVYTAAAPSFTPVRLTRHLQDDGIDLTGLSIADDGSTVVFVRGHDPNREGWVANPMSNADGAERNVWAVRTSGASPAWLVARNVTGAPRLAPNGRAVLFVREGQVYRAPVVQAVAPVESGRGVSSAPSRAVVDAAQAKPYFTAFGTNSDPQWSPDGSKIAFVSNRGDHSFIGLHDVRTRKVSYVAPSVDFDSSPTWSPDGTQIAFIRRPGAAFAQQIAQAAAAAAGRGGRGAIPGGGRGRGGRGADVPRSNIPGLSHPTFTGGYTLSFMVAAAVTHHPGITTAPEPAAREFWHNQPGDEVFARINSIDWAGDHVIFQLEPEEWIRYYSVPVAGSVAWSEDPIPAGSEDSALRMARRQITPNATPAMLTPGDGMVEQISLSSDGRHLFYATNAGDIDRRHVWKVPTAGGDAVQITRGTAIETYPAALASGTRVALLTADTNRPQSVGVVSAAGGDVKVIYPTLPPGFPAAAHVVPQNVTLKAEDGLQFNNQLFLPRGVRPGERRPAVIFVHGGPQRQMVLGYHYRHFYHMAYGVNQWLASQGYVVLSVNYRSGIGYGRSFRTAPNTGGRGNAEYQDVLAAGKYLQSLPDVDPARIGIWGLSYGGILTAQALARNSDIFKVGVDLAGVHLRGTSLEPGTVTYDSSVISQIGAWKSPVLLLHGDDDRNVAFSQTTGLVQLLRGHKVYHELIVFPDDVHDSLLYSRWLYTFDRMTVFLGKFLGATGSKITSSGR
jgi:dipeptidyl aminopeptidase/acylaminoacyl peptidase